MKITKTCWYKTAHFNVLPAIIIKMERDGFILQFKWLYRHAGVQFSDTAVCDQRLKEGRY